MNRQLVCSSDFKTIPLSALINNPHTRITRLLTLNDTTKKWEDVSGEVIVSSELLTAWCKIIRDGVHK